MTLRLAGGKLLLEPGGKLALSDGCCCNHVDCVWACCEVNGTYQCLRADPPVYDCCGDLGGTTTGFFIGPCVESCEAVWGSCPGCGLAPPGCADGPWCVTIEWDLVLDDVGDGLPAATLQGSANVWVNEDPTDPSYAVRTCLNGAAVSDAPFTDTGCDGSEVADFCDPGSSVNYGGVASGECVQFTWEFTGFGAIPSPLVLVYQGDGSGTLALGTNTINESYLSGQITLTGTVTLSIAGNAAVGDCGCP